MRSDVVETRYSSRKWVWVRELLLIAICYSCYSWVRNQFGSASVTSDTAYRNADYMIETERFFGLYFEPTHKVGSILGYGFALLEYFLRNFTFCSDAWRPDLSVFTS